MTKAFALKFSMKALFFLLMNHTKERLPKLVRQPLCCYLFFAWS